MSLQSFGVRGRIKEEHVISDGTYLGEASEQNRHHLRPRINGPKPLKLITAKGELTFSKFPMAIVVDPVLTASAKVVWAYLLFRQGKNETAWPSQQTISTHTRLSRATVARSTAQLEAQGWLKVHRVKAGTQRWNSYVVLIPPVIRLSLSTSESSHDGSQEDEDKVSKKGFGPSHFESVKEPLINSVKELREDTHQSRLVTHIERNESQRITANDF